MIGRIMGKQVTRRNVSEGFSLVELMIALALILILSTIALPSLTRALKNYQLSASASQLSGLVKFGRTEAIRRNTVVACQIQQAGSDWIVWVDSNGNGAVDTGETRILIRGNATLLSQAAAPSPAVLTSALGITNLTVLSGSNGSVSYDSRGAVHFASGQPTVYVLYVGSATDADFGYQAVILLPSGVTQLWAASSVGDWHQIS